MTATHRQVIDLRDKHPRPARPLPESIWSRRLRFLPSLGAMNTAAAVADLYWEAEVLVDA